MARKATTVGIKPSGITPGKAGHCTKPFVITEEMRKAVAGALYSGLNQDITRGLIINRETGKPLAKDTFRKSFAYEIEHFKELAKGHVKNTAYAMAMSGQHPAMTIFYLKTQCGWKEPPLEVRGAFTLEQLVTGAHKQITPDA